MFEALVKALGAGLSIWEHKEKTKYADRLMNLKRSYYEEINKDRTQRSNATLDNLEFELRILVDSFSSSVGKPDA